MSNIRYNSLNLPEEVTVGNIEGSGSIKYSYSGTGTKLSTQHTNSTYPARSKTTKYVGNLVYENGALKRVLVEGGYVEGGVHHFFLEDYLGNVRVVANGSGDVVQKNAYYPFGMAFAGSPGGAAGGVGASAADQAKQPYKFGGKELDQAFGLDQYDFSARYYDPATARFTSQDPLAEKRYNISPYAYCSNNPITRIDPDGRDDYYTKNGKFLLRDNKTSDYIIIRQANEYNKISNSFAWQNQKRTEHTDTKLQDMTISAEAYSNIFTDILGKNGVDVNTLHGNAVSTKTVDGMSITGRFNDPSKIDADAAYTLLDGKHRLTGTIYSGDGRNEAYSTVSNILHTLRDHEYKGHGILNMSDGTKLYDWLKTSPAWESTTDQYKIDHEFIRNEVYQIRESNAQFLRENRYR